MELKKLSATDKNIITELFLSVFSNEPWNDDWSDREQLDAYISDLTGNINSLTLGYFDGERLIALSMGNIRHWWRGTEYCIDEFCVERTMQGKGIGSSFMKSIEQYLSERGINTIFLQTERTVPAYSFYTGRGFTDYTDHASLGKSFGEDIAEEDTFSGDAR